MLRTTQQKPRSADRPPPPLPSGTYIRMTAMAKNTSISLDETAESRLEVLRQALREGERSGRADYSYDSLVFELDAEQL